MKIRTSDSWSRVSQEMRNPNEQLSGFKEFAISLLAVTLQYNDLTRWIVWNVIRQSDGRTATDRRSYDSHSSHTVADDESRYGSRYSYGPTTSSSNSPVSRPEESLNRCVGIVYRYCIEQLLFRKVSTSWFRICGQLIIRDGILMMLLLKKSAI